MRPLSVFFAALTLIAATGERDRTYSNKAHHYSFTVPTGWRVENDDTPYIFKYHDALRGNISEIPQNGAAIRIIAFDPSRDGPDFGSWVRHRARIRQRDVVLESFPCGAISMKAEPCAKVKSVWQMTPDDPALRTVSLYVVLRGKYYCVCLEYNVGDTRAAEYEVAMNSVALSMSSTGVR